MNLSKQTNKNDMQTTNRKSDWSDWKTRLRVSYWHGQTIIETSGVGRTKKEAKENWFRQYYGSMGYLMPKNPVMPSRDLIEIKWEKREKREVKP